MSLSKVEEILFDGDEVVKIRDEEIELSKFEFKREKISLDEYIERVKTYPSLEFDAYQRLYAALKAFGRTKTNKPGKADRWRFLDNPIKGYKDKPGVGALYDVEDSVDEIMNFLRLASYDKDMKGRLLLLVSNVGAGKSNVIWLMTKALDYVSTLEPLRVYTVVFDLYDVRNRLRKEYEKLVGKNDLTEDERRILENFRKFEEEFGDINEFICPAHERPLNILKELDYNLYKSLINEINEKEKYRWKKIGRNPEPCPSCQHIINTLRDIGLNNEEIKRTIRVINLNTIGNSAEVSSKLVEVPQERSSLSVDLLEGSNNMNRFVKLGGKKDHPLTLDFGVGGYIDGPSSQRAMLHWSEILKGEEEFIRGMLDLVQNKVLMVRGKFSVYIDSVFIGTTNLEEIEKIRQSPIAKTILNRSYLVLFPYSTTIDGASKIIKEIFKDFEYHIPPNFIERGLAPFYVISSLEEAPEKNIDRAMKALLYNGEIPHGMESTDLIRKAEEMRKVARNKDILEVVEGVRYGFSVRLLQDLKNYLNSELRKRARNVGEEVKCLAFLGPELRVILESFIEMQSEINEKTKEIAKKEAILAISSTDNKYNFFLVALANDVTKAIIGEETILSKALTYVSMIEALVTSNSYYLDYLTSERKYVDKRFVEDIEKELSLKVSISDWRKIFLHRFNDILSTYKTIYKDRENKEVYLLAIKDLLSRDVNFRRAIETYCIKALASVASRDIAAFYSPSNNKVVEELKKMGYCDVCAQYALRVASEFARAK